MSPGSAEAGGLRGRPSQRPGRGPRTRFRAAPPSHLQKQPLYPRAGLPHGAKAAAAAPTARRDVSTAERTSFPELLLSGPTSVEQTAPTLSDRTFYVAYKSAIWAGFSKHGLSLLHMASPAGVSHLGPRGPISRRLLY